MYVIKRNGEQEAISFDKITDRIKKLCYGLDTKYIDPVVISQKVIQGLYNGITTTELDQLASEICAFSSTHHFDYSTLAARIAVSNLHKSTDSVFSRNVKKMYEYTHPKTGKPAPLVSKDFYTVVMENAEILDNNIYYDRDYTFDYFGFKTLERSYLLKMNDKVSERPQQMLMRCAVAVHTAQTPEGPKLDIQEVINTYNLMSQRFFTHATPSLYNAGMPRQQLSSCFLMHTEDSIDHIYKTLKDCAIISKYSGGIGINIHDIRAARSYISGTNGTSNGIVPMLRVFNDTARYVDQSGRRKGSFAIYIETHHNDIYDFLDLKKNNGKEEIRARDLFYGLWISDLFMKRVEDNADWTLFCPNEAHGLSDVYGEEFEKLYTQYETEGRGRQTVKAQHLWFAILQSQIETGTPYMLYKDAANQKSNQKNLGTIKSSNLCVAPETLILTDKGEFPIKYLLNEKVKVWNGNQWSETFVSMTGSNQSVIGIDILVRYKKNDEPYSFEIKHIDCTPYHKFILDDCLSSNMKDKTDIKNIKRVDAKDLKRGDCLLTWVNHKGFTVESFIIDKIDNGRKCNTYCFNEPLNNAGVFNGVLLGNCTEIIEYTSKDEVAVCNLGSIALNSFVKNSEGKTIFDYTKLLEVSKTITKNLNKVIDINFYPIPEAEYSNKRHRPIGIGVQALADTFALLEYPFESPDAIQLNRNIFETIYFGAVSASCDLAMKYGPYETYEGSPASKGQLQFDLWGVKPNTDSNLGPVYDWSELKDRIKKYGMRNSLLLAPMPTASTAQILGNNESIEPFTSNIYSRRVLAGEFPIVNKHLMKKLIELGLWNDKMRQQIIGEKGSIQNIPGIPQKLKDVYKTVWEIKMKTVIDMAADRGPYVCQSQSMNLFIADPTLSKLTSMHFYAWKKGLKTGMYYLRTKPKADAIQFTIDQSMMTELRKEESKSQVQPKTLEFQELKAQVELQPKVSETKAEAAARKRREIREAMEKGEFEISDDVCINCSG